MAKVALLIGVSEYGQGLNPLPSAVKDVEAMQRVLQHPEIGQFDQVKTLTDPDPQAIQREVEALFRDRTKNDLVLLFFSGHGIKDDNGRLYFASSITHKTTQGELVKWSAVPASFVHDMMVNSRSKRQIVLLDCCFSGAFAEDMRAKDDGSVDIQTQLGGEGRAVLTSSSSTQYSFEQQGSDLSVYTRFLVEGLETGAADVNGSGDISIDELHEYARRKVQESAPAMKPKIYIVEEGFRILLAKAPIGDPKLNYRKEVERFASHGEISDIARYTLDSRQRQLGISSVEAQEIEAQVLKPYQEYKQKLQQYEDVLAKTLKRENPLHDKTRQELRRLQEVWGLEDQDVASIETKLLLSRVDNREESQSQPLSSPHQQSIVTTPKALTLPPPSESAPPSVQPQHRVEIPSQLDQPHPATPSIRGELARIDWMLWFQWILATAVGQSITNATIYAIVGDYNPLTGGSAYGGILTSGFVGGAIFGITQSLILQRCRTKLRWWLVSTWGGYAVGSALMVLNDNWWAFGAISGTMLGFCQFLILQQHFSKAVWWILASAVSGTINWAVIDKTYGPNALLMGCVAGMVTGAITGGALVWILQRPNRA